MRDSFAKSGEADCYVNHYYFTCFHLTWILRMVQSLLLTLSTWPYLQIAHYMIFIWFVMTLFLFCQLWKMCLQFI